MPHHTHFDHCESSIRGDKRRRGESTVHIANMHLGTTILYEMRPGRQQLTTPPFHYNIMSQSGVEIFMWYSSMVQKWCNKKKRERKEKERDVVAGFTLTESGWCSICVCSTVTFVL